jgi:membrane fusion protein (multidrug efflux system)
MSSNAITIWSRILCCSVVGLLLCSLGCSNKSAGEEEGGSETSPSAVPEVTLIQVTRADISSTLTITGTIAALPNRDVRISSLVAGRVSRMLVAEGDRVKEGQVLAAIEDRPYRDQLQQAQASVEQAKANLENARLNLQRNENLFQRGIAARKDLEDARTQASVAESSLQQAQAALALARLQISRTEVRAPLTGTVVKRFVSVGEQVDGTAAQPLLEVADTTEVELFGNVPALYLENIHVGDTLPIATDTFAGREFKGRVVAISPSVDPATDVGLVRIRIANGAGLLRLGMFLSAQMPLETHAHALVVPPQAVYRDEQGQPRIFRVQGNEAEAVPVKLGIETQQSVELLSGAQEGETVILTGGYGLGARAKIKVKQ